MSPPRVLRSRNVEQFNDDSRALTLRWPQPQPLRPFFFSGAGRYMQSALSTVRAMAHAIAPSRTRALRLLDFNQHQAWAEFQRWHERSAGPRIMPYRVQARQKLHKPGLEDRYIWAIDMGRSFAQLAPSHQAILLLLVSGDSLQMRAHSLGTSVRTLMRRRDAALEQLARIRSDYHADAQG